MSLKDNIGIAVELPKGPRNCNASLAFWLGVLMTAVVLVPDAVPSCAITDAPLPPPLDNVTVGCST